MSPSAATTMELLQVKVIADLLEQSWCRRRFVKFSRTHQEPTGVGVSRCGGLSGIIVWCSWSEEALGMGKTQPGPSAVGWRLVLDWVGWWGAASWGGSSENVGF